ncbi:hypothetical protein QTQ03_28065 [Micromonospora sp. WMMA1363]|uniref:DUF6907 domain-containing protein n=1 Tax=Micromonospora sp. WMMA1363 TaxID=3053985 RepID=UPI00259CA0D1|nr:hypothetical protein [Micromonospora sp. WMMA1363]MDM4721177.1 hypothetical protein [Micromonospora sp. WMMA1363]MDM4723265.1 hypothetical protein [Micromonospora sp. WMMA1363]
MSIIAHAPTSASPIVPPDFPSKCPPWCVDCWKGGDSWETPDPGVTFHHGATRTIVATDGPEQREVEISLERLDADGEEGATQVYVRSSDGAFSLSLDEAELLAAELFSLLVRGRRDGQQ